MNRLNGMKKVIVVIIVIFLLLGVLIAFNSVVSGSTTSSFVTPTP